MSTSKQRKHRTDGSTLDLVIGRRRNQTTLTQQGFCSSTSYTVENEAQKEFDLCAAIMVNYVFSFFIGRPGTDDFNRAHNQQAIDAHSTRLTHCVDFFDQGEVPLHHGADTCKIQNCGSNQPWRTDQAIYFQHVIERLKARRSKGIKWSEDEALADAERMPWCFNESSSDESSSSDDDKDEPPAKKRIEWCNCCMMKINGG